LEQPGTHWSSQELVGRKNISKISVLLYCIITINLVYIYHKNTILSSIMEEFVGAYVVVSDCPRVNASFVESLTQIHFHAGKGMHVLKNVGDIPVYDIPPDMFHLCSGLVMISATEVGFGFTSQSGAGVAVKRHGDKWAPPVAVTLSGMGIGAVVGAADKDILIVLNPAAMKRLLEGKGEVKIGVDMGLGILKGAPMLERITQCLTREASDHPLCAPFPRASF
jgi:hypothetical protein